MFQVDEMVAVCYDAKLSRAVEGKILYTTPKGLRIGVHFKPWANEQVGFVELYLQRSCGIYSGFLEGPGESLIMRSLGSVGDYYTVVPLDIVKEMGYYVDLYDRPPYMEDRDEENRRL